MDPACRPASGLAPLVGELCETLVRWGGVLSPYNHFEGQEDLVSRLVVGITRMTIWAIGVTRNQ